jgi:hypothetical protein
MKNAALDMNFIDTTPALLGTILRMARLMHPLLTSCDLQDKFLHRTSMILASFDLEAAGFHVRAESTKSRQL